MSAPWMKFYPRDWRGDQALRAVSIAARGIWMECLCIMHEARPYGHLMLNGQPVEDGALARMTGASVDEVSALMAELRKAGAFSVTREGVIFSRRMTKDHARANKGRKAVQKRWTQQTENKEKSDEPIRSAIRPPITQKPEAREIEKEEPNGSSKKRGSRLPDDFIPDIADSSSLSLSPSEHAQEAAKFRDYWIAQPGQKGVKLDWPATWRNWCRTAAERRRGNPRSTSPPNRRRNFADVAIDRFSGAQDDGTESVFGNHGHVERLPAREREPGSDDEDLRGHPEGRVSTINH